MWKFTGLIDLFERRHSVHLNSVLLPEIGHADLPDKRTKRARHGLEGLPHALAECIAHDACQIARCHHGALHDRSGAACRVLAANPHNLPDEFGRWQSLELLR